MFQKTLKRNGQKAETLALRGQATTAQGLPVTSPRIAVYHPWSPSMDEGWSRWLLEQYKFKFTELTNTVAQKGHLREQFDVMLLADERSRTAGRKVSIKGSMA